MWPRQLMHYVGYFRLGQKTLHPSTPVRGREAPGPMSPVRQSVALTERAFFSHLGQDSPFRWAEPEQSNPRSPQRRAVGGAGGRESGAER